MAFLLYGHFSFAGWQELISPLLDDANLRIKNAEHCLSFVQNWVLVKKDCDDEWVFVHNTEQESKLVRINESDVDEAEDKGIAADQILAQLRAQISAAKDVHAVDDLEAFKQVADARIDILDQLKKRMCIVVRRTDADLYKSLQETYEANFEGIPVKINIKHVYFFLGFNNDVPRSIDLALVQERLEKIKNSDYKDFDKDTMEKLKDLSHQNTMSLVRQLNFSFSDKLAKQEYDAFLQGKQAIEQLKIDADFRQELDSNIQQVVFCRESLKDCNKVIQGKITALQSAEQQEAQTSQLNQLQKKLFSIFAPFRNNQH